MQQARAQGLRRINRVYGTTWIKMAIPAGSTPAQAVAAARKLPVSCEPPRTSWSRSTSRFLRADPLYKNDDDPSTKPCDPFSQICDPFDLVDQWGLFKVEAGTRGRPVTPARRTSSSPSSTAASRSTTTTCGGTSGRTPAEIAGNGIDDDGNGLVDDVHGADFVGSNVGSPLDDPTSQDGNPDIPMGGTWVFDPTATFGIRLRRRSGGG